MPQRIGGYSAWLSGMLCGHSAAVNPQRDANRPARSAQGTPRSTSCRLPPARVHETVDLVGGESEALANDLPP